MENTNIAPLSGNLRKTLVRLLGTAAPIMAMAMPGAAMAQTAVNTARVAAPAGAFEINAANNESTDTDTVLAVIVATNDSATGINGLAGATAVVNAFTADTVNGVAASPSNATLSVAPGAVPAGLVFDTATGNVNVAAGTPAGTYSFTYTICETLNPTNCQTATISVTVVAAPIAADPDTVSGVNGANGAPNVLDVIAGDTLNGTQVTLAQVNLTVTTPATPASPGAPVPSLNVATGQVSVPAGTPAGTYTITYQICEQLNPTNCATNTATVVVAASPIVATDDSASGINGLAGGTGVVNAFASDTINGVAASPSNAVLSVASGSSVPAGLTFNTSTGNVDVAPGTPAGTYSFDYQICEALNPTNCQIATITVTVVAAAIAADPDNVSGVNGATGAPNVLDVLDGDTLNGNPVTLAQVNLTVTTPATPASPGAPVPALNPATGQVSVPAGTPAGTYTITYQICEQLNPTNCATNTATVVVAASPIVATDDSASGINGLAGGTGVVNAFASDTINGVAASPSNAVLSVASGSSVPAGLTFNTSTGNVDVAPGTPAGTYSFDYQICEALNPTNCQIATITVTVVAAAIAADPDNVSGVNGATGAPNVLDVLDGDTLNGNPVTLAQVNLTVTTPATPASPGAPVPALNPATGQISVPAGTPAGTYTITYQICEQLNPTNCATNTATVVVAASPIVATDDSASGINGLAGGTGVVNAFASDTINGVAASPSNAVLSVASGSSVPAGLTFNTSTGNVDVAPGTPAGTYSFDYQICEALNPTNCQIATITVTVVAAAIAADPDNVSGVNGATGAPNVLDVLDGDTLNGNPVTLAQVNLTVTTPATPASPGAPVPALNPATGQISVPAGTPAGTYTITYQICEQLNPTNCATNTATVVVAASPIVATDDSASGINGLAGGTGVVNAFASDTINGVAASPSNAVLSVASGSSVPAGLTFNTSTGNVDVAPGTPAGTYSFDYQICEALNPTNCQIATITVTVVAAAIAADPDNVSGVNGATGAPNVLDVLDGDTLNGNPVTLAQVNLTVTTPATPASPGAPVPALNPATGQVSVPAGTPAGTYTITYQICEQLNPTNCATNTATVVVNPSVDLVMTKSNGTTSVFSGSTTTYTLTVTNNGPDAATGAVVTDTPGAGLTCPAGNAVTFSGPGAPAGSYTIANLTGAGITLATLGNGQSVTITYSCQVN
jgi:hypothetical protein